MTFHASYEKQECCNCKNEFVTLECLADKEEAEKYREEHKDEMPIHPSKKVMSELDKLNKEVPYQVCKCPYRGEIVANRMDLVIGMLLASNMEVRSGEDKK